MPDHVRRLVSLGRTISVADMVRLVKSNPSGWVHDELKVRDFQRQTGYYSNIDAVKTYIANQQRHHQTQSFQDEFASCCGVMIWNGTNGMYGIEARLSPR